MKTENCRTRSKLKIYAKNGKISQKCQNMSKYLEMSNSDGFKSFLIDFYIREPNFIKIGPLIKKKLKKAASPLKRCICCLRT